MIRVDPFLDRQLTTKYRCLDFVREVWLDAFGEDIAGRLTHLVNAVAAKRLKPSTVRGFEAISAPIDPCFVVMLRHGVSPHIGIYTRGRVLHLSWPNAEFQPIHVARRGFASVRFYR